MTIFLFGCAFLFLSNIINISFGFISTSLSHYIPTNTLRLYDCNSIDSSNASSWRCPNELHPLHKVVTSDPQYISELSLLWDLATKHKPDLTREAFIQSIKASYAVQNQDLIVEFENLNGPSALNIFRRNIGLRLNRVLIPARNAQIFVNLYSSLISDGYWESLVNISNYVGFAPSTYYDSTAGCVRLTSIAKYVTEMMLELNLEMLGWVHGGKLGAQPLTMRENDSCPQEWFYTQIQRPDTARRTRDMLLATLRLALRYGLSEISSCDTRSVLLVKLGFEPLLANSGLGLDDHFSLRAYTFLSADISSLDAWEQSRVLFSLDP